MNLFYFDRMHEEAEEEVEKGKDEKSKKRKGSLKSRRYVSRNCRLGGWPKHASWLPWQLCDWKQNVSSVTCSVCLGATGQPAERLTPHTPTHTRAAV